MAATSHLLSSSVSPRALPNHVIVKRERGDIHGVSRAISIVSTTTTNDLDDRVIITDVKETVISINNSGKAVCFAYDHIINFIIVFSIRFG